MEKLNMQTHNLAEYKLKKLQELFPNAVTEVMNENGEIEKAIDKDVLMQEISSKVVEGREERYQFTWPDKKQSILAANAPISKTLRPCRNESKNFDTTENLYIEGDNLEVLKLLQETYLGKIKMIYIDPPYNTGSNLIYKNDFKILEDDYSEKSGQFDEQGYQLFENPESNGRFHTDWLNMIYPRLKLARNLLNSTGYIVVAIDDNEVYNLKKICDEVFGEPNFIGTIITRCNPQGRNKNNIDPVHEYHLVYSKNIDKLPLLKIKKINSYDEYRNLMRSGTNSRKNERPNRFYPLLVSNDKIEMIREDEYTKIYSKELGFNEQFIDSLRYKYEKLGYKFILPISKDGEEKVWQRTFDRVLREFTTYVYKNGQIKVPVSNDRTPTTLWIEDRYSNVSNGTNSLKKMFEDKIFFDFSKSKYTVKDFISLNSNQQDIILDFFSGSATTAEAVMQLNAEDGGNRKYIMVQLPEQTDEKSQAYKAGYKNICEIGKERIRRAGEKILEENKEKENIDKLDVGFRVLKTDSSNMKDVYYSPENTEQSFLDNLEDNIKEDRTQEDLLFQVMLDLGVPLSSNIEVEQIEDAKVFKVEDRFLVACFDGAISDEVVKQIADMKPFYAVFRDMSMKNDSVAVNFEQIFESISPETIRKVL
ncbi:site-specific DNA-methyltransferase [Finegoldia magna]|uniref:site-specific DNA-methyltransferase n=1 Tax=Finegoldia magna TaxID=1260 RepID=UPI0026EF75B1|nr:site-specific DNA-methyltransferase [Finegoldia magna]